MEATPPPMDAGRAEPPLWSIGLAVLIILVAPVLLYSLAPTGPLREGDTIFAEGQQRVTFVPAAASPTPSDETCLLDPGHPLIIVRPAAEQPDGTILAKVQGNPAIEWPFCPPHAAVLLRPHQIFQKPDVFGGLRPTLAGLIGGEGAASR